MKGDVACPRCGIIWSTSQRADACRVCDLEERTKKLEHDSLPAIFQRYGDKHPEWVAEVAARRAK